MDHRLLGQLPNQLDWKFINGVRSCQLQTVRKKGNKGEEEEHQQQKAPC